MLTLAGVVGFFYSASFGSPGTTGEAAGLFDVNGWSNLLHLLTGTAGLLFAGFAPRRYALWAGLLYLALGVWGLIGGDGTSALGLLPAGGGNAVLHLSLGALGLCAALATSEPRRAGGPPRAKRTAAAT